MGGNILWETNMSVGSFFNAERVLEKAWGHILYEHFIGGGGLDGKSKFPRDLVNCAYGSSFY